ncbi:uncharacterized protein K02A2.6-like [Aricia agestis]|uniref:uncharacterized protein K02A2.6-like n=1 Tax=Aricia agestis TaxID=91739 RepID=UPI001C206B69|nr:uncharacterized protein K02A2.6-like [Aricia agestis]
MAEQGASTQPQMKITSEVPEGLVSDISAVSVQSRMLPFWRQHPRAWFLHFEAVVDPLKTSDDQKYRYLLQQLQQTDLEHITDILYDPTASKKYEKVKQRLLETYDTSDVKNFQKLVSGLELGDLKPSQLMRKMKELASGMITDEGLRIEWMNRLPAQVRVILSINKESSLETLAAMADKMVEYAEVPSVAAVTATCPAPAPSTSSASEPSYMETLARQIEKLTLEKQEEFGKLTRTPTVADVGVSRTSHRLCVFDRDTRERFLVDTGADISVLAATQLRKKKRTEETYKLYAANNTPIKTYGEETIKLNLGLRRSFRWTFVVADIKTSILGADFLHHYKLLVDLHTKRLVDKVTDLSVNAVKVVTDIESVHVVSSDQAYHDILKLFPNVLRPMSLKQPSKHDVVHHIETTGPPLFARARPLPPDKYKTAQLEFERMMEMGICKPSKSPWASPLHVVKKKDGTLRVCGDYRRLNAVTLPDRYPIPRIQDFTYKLHGKKLFSKLDLKMAYFWIPISKEDAEKTAIITPFGLFEFNCMTFGLRNASQTFQRFMHQILRGIDGCFSFVDDLLIFAEDEDSHKKLLRQVLERLDQNGVTLNIEKCEFGKKFPQMVLNPAKIASRQ